MQVMSVSFSTVVLFCSLCCCCWLSHTCVYACVFDLGMPNIPGMPDLSNIDLSSVMSNPNFMNMVCVYQLSAWSLKLRVWYQLSA